MIARSPTPARRSARAVATPSAARRAARSFLRDQMRDERGRLLRTYNDGSAKIDAYLEDHAFLLEALIALFEATCEERWFDAGDARSPTRLIARFADPEQGRLLLDRRRRRSADRAAQGPRGLADPLRRLERRRSACCASPS